MSVLADTSVWVDYLRDGRSGRAADLDGLLADGEVVMCGPVAAELIAGVAPDLSATLWRRFSGLTWADLDRSAWFRVGQVSSSLRRSGQRVALTDIQIAVAATQVDALLWTRDSDFDRVQEALPQLRRFTP